MQDNMKRNNIRLMGIPEGEEEEQGIENLFEKVIMENFPNLRREKSHPNPENTESPQQEKPKDIQTANINDSLRPANSGDQGDCTIESHGSSTIEVHTRNPRSKNRSI